MAHGRIPRRRLAALALLGSVAACATPAPSASDVTQTTAPSPVSSAMSRLEGRGEMPYVAGAPLELASLAGRIVFDDYEDLWTMGADATDLRRLGERPGAEFDGAWSPDGRWIVYRDSRRGINEDDEIFVMAADGSDVRNLTDDPANDWGPDWSPDGQWVIFNSDRDGHPMGAYVVRPDGTELQRLPIDGWVEYASFSPDGSRIAYMGHGGDDYDIYVADIESGASARLTDAPGSDGWPAWSPDGSAIAFKSQRDDCLYADADVDCWHGDEPGEHDDIWIMDADGANQRRVTPEAGQFVAWSPDGATLLVSGRTLFVVRLDGTGRVEVRPDGMRDAPGGLPDWTAATPPG
jgi:Tol biopolymer transport system component